MKGAYATKGNQWVSYNDVQFVKEKADYVIKNKYGGVAVFTMDMDDFNNNCCQVRFIEIKWLYINLLRGHLWGAFAHTSGMSIVLI
jgi:GH18 family chitinase